MIYTVSQLNGEIKHRLESNFSLVQIEGEISNFICAQSGHWYFSLKDAQSQIRCVMFKFKNQYVRQACSNGDHVIIRGRLSVYEPRGEYQITIDSLKPAGTGDLQTQFDALKQSLLTEGLFDASRKRPLPAFSHRGIKRIGIVTSPTGAAIHDVLTVLKRRYPLSHVKLYPSLVQGADAAPQLCQAIQTANQDAVCDVLLITRGGGSLEDLWCFNNEQLARTIASSRIPTVSAVGHEVDSTIADFVADASAPTPSAAAELLSPNQTDTARHIEQLQNTLQHSTQKLLNEYKAHAQRLEHRLQQQHPHKQLEIKAQRFDELMNRLQKCMLPSLCAWQFKIDALQLKMTQNHPKQWIERYQTTLNSQSKQLNDSIKRLLAQKQHALQLSSRGLHAVSPLNTLGRGYAISKDAETGAIISRGADIQPEQTLLLQFQDQTISVTSK